MKSGEQMTSHKAISSFFEINFPYKVVPLNKAILRAFCCQNKCVEVINTEARQSYQNKLWEQTGDAQ